MSASTREARPDEIEDLWPMVRGSHIFGTLEDLVRFHVQGPWRVRVNDRGDAYLIHRWRAHLDFAALKHMWASPRTVPDLVRDARGVAAERGLDRVISPLLPFRSRGPYLEADMESLERIVAFSVGIDRMRFSGGRAHRVDLARADDLGDLVALEVACFEPFWRHGADEIVEAMEQDARVSVVRDEAGVVAASAISALSGSVVTVARLATAPWARRRGMAKALLADARAWAESCGAVGLSLCTQSSNQPARRLYEAVGFQQAAEEYVLLVTRKDARSPRAPDCGYTGSRPA